MGLTGEDENVPVVGPVSKVGDDGLGGRGSDVDMPEHATIENAGFDSGFRNFTCRLKSIPSNTKALAR